MTLGSDAASGEALWQPLARSLLSTGRDPERRAAMSAYLSHLGGGGRNEEKGGGGRSSGKEEGEVDSPAAAAAVQRRT